MAIKVISWVAVVIGALAIFSGLVDASYDPEYMYTIIGGGLYLSLGLLTLDYVRKHPDTK